MPVETRGSKKRRLSDIEAPGDDAVVSSSIRKSKKARPPTARTTDAACPKSPLGRSSITRENVSNTDASEEHPSVKCIYILPDEVLSLIFETSYTSVPDAFAFAKRISQVSRRFRSVAFSTPCLWTTVSNRQAPLELKAFLERSGAARLKILIFVKEGRQAGEGIDQFAEALMPYIRHKWILDDKHIEYMDDLPGNESPTGSFAKLAYKILFAISVVLMSTRAML